ncbi:MAG: radical SAM protein, partial [Euryarchaeota archaeon]|nr:radical SAM protein [Euryarchaeota archaeon]
MDTRIKAILIAEGSADVDPELLGISRTSTAGPGAGVESFFFRSEEHRVRLDSKRDPDALLKVRRIDDDTRDADRVAILHNGEELVRGRIEPALLHCPEQAYITISESCIFNCTFCPVPKLKGRTKSLEEIVRMVDDAYRTKKMRAIAITSGIEHSPEEEVTRAVNAVNALTRYNLPIGVSVYPTVDSSLHLKEAGAIEIKYNIETMDQKIFRRACADMNFDFVLTALEDAVNIFGRNRVFSNFIVGLGESDRTVKEGVETLAELGVIPILRALNLHPLRPDLKKICPDARRPDADRLLALAQYEREVLDAHGLRADVAETMCLPCGG